ncbi:MAG: hypothetical protein KMY50_07320, partial [Candidatus Desulforudis sp.]|nr:hypothetical protein [Desulforudis sp.]
MGIRFVCPVVRLRFGRFLPSTQAECWAVLETGWCTILETGWCTILETGWCTILETGWCTILETGW